MRCLCVTIVLATLLISGCATSYSVDESGKTALVTYRRDLSHEHYFSERTGEVVAKGNDISGPLYSSIEGRTGRTGVYYHQSESCATFPKIMGGLDRNNGSLSIKVKAGVPLVNSYRTEYQTCRRECHKLFYTSSVFIPEENARYEAVVEPIDGVTLYKIVDGKRIKQTDITQAAGNCRY